MIKQRFLIIVTLLLTLLLTCCNAANPPKTETPAVSEISPVFNPSHTEAEYIKISPEEAQAMMSDDVVVLDVRTKDEYDEEHIMNAILLPDYEIKEKAESVISDKNQTILVYCRTGRRSEIAAKELIGMGYTKIFDFGGIMDWTGEIVCDVTGNIFYNYFGGNLPDDIITPVDYSVTKSINNKMQDFKFRIEGINTKKYSLSNDKIKYFVNRGITEITKLTISCEYGSFKQEFINLHTSTWATEDDMYGLSIDDWNFDGYQDISLWRYLGGTLLDCPHYYWLWDNTTGEFAANTELEEISKGSTVSVNHGKNQIYSYARYGSGGYGKWFYEYKSGSFIMVKSEESNFERIQSEEDKYGVHIIIQKLINGEMTITADYYE